MIAARLVLPAIWLVFGFLTRALPADAAARPNVVLILADDLGWADLGCYGSTFHQTPRLDRMAREGMRFTHAYAAGPVCSPTRASLLTGQHPARLHLTDWLPGRPDRKDQKLRRPLIATNLPAALVTLAEVFQASGYATASIGKWHLGGNAASLPTAHGFDLNIAGDHRGTPASYFAPFGRGSNPMPRLQAGPAEQYLTDRLAEEAVQFIASHRAKPFFLYLPHFAVHTPLTAKSNLVAKFRALARPGGAQTNAIYAAMLQSLDENVGRILDALQVHGLTTNTLVIFTSDNGGLSVREGPNTPATSNSPLRAGKGHLYDGGLRVPLLARWPGVVPTNVVEDTPVLSTDLFFTILELAGLKAPSAQAADGLSIAGALRAQSRPAARPLHWHYPHYSNQGGKPGGAIREGDHKLIEFYESGYLELYNLRDDPGETNNLAGSMPQLANDLAKKLHEWRASVGAQMMPSNPEYESVALSASADGTFVLPAHEATVHGRNLRYEPPAHKNTLGYWTKTEDWASWNLAVAQPAQYRVEILQGCGKGSGGSEVELVLTGGTSTQTVAFVVQDTGHFQNFVAREVGRFTLGRAGVHTLAVKPRNKAGAAVMDLRRVRLLPVAGASAE